MLQVYRDLSGKASWEHVKVVWRDLRRDGFMNGSNGGGEEQQQPPSLMPSSASSFPSFYDRGAYLIEGVFTRRPREARQDAMTGAALAARLKRQVCV